MATKTTLRVMASQAAAILVFCGWKSAADKWGDQPDILAAKLKDLNQVAPRDGDTVKVPEEEALAKVMLDVLAASEAKEEIEVYLDEATEAGDTAAGAEGGAADAPAAGKGKVKKEKAPKAPKEKAPKAEVLSRGYFAGQVVAEHGYGTITDAMVVEVDKLYGKENPTVSRGALKWACDALKGYMSKTQAEDAQEA